MHNLRLEDQVLENLTSTWRKEESGRIHGLARLMGDIARSSLADTTLKGVDQPPVAPWAPQSDQLEKLSHNKALAKVK